MHVVFRKSYVFLNSTCDYNIIVFICKVNLQSSHAFVLVISTYFWINSFLLPKALFVVFICNYAPTVR